MRRIAMAVVSTIAALVLMFSYRTSLGATTTGSSQAKIIAGPTVAAPETSTVTGGAAATSTTPVTPATSPVVVDGKTVDTRYGPIAVRITVSNGQITDATALTYPDSEGRSRQINQQALPVLRSEVISAQSADIQAVSGATYTSAGYVESLQSALDLAGK